ncbi:hypothetical protein HW450_04625 [Corynebacterium hindlerae]|uniref:Uncharacterized protein n=1 Tax=Corynebacterium hindlerae TaxID=699041 RepID=A0A7G5FHB6_9CORY|nr:hypothetical protein [Corynebacterium hindlerae]QMV86007.1 hypothetical protein HW450_04625 [Corynebacterium hindlerae]
MSLLFFDPVVARELSDSVRRSIDFVQPCVVRTTSEGAFPSALQRAVQRLNTRAEYYQRFLDRVSANSDHVIDQVRDADVTLGYAMEELG